MLGLGLRLGKNSTAKWWPDQASFAIDFTTNRAMLNGTPRSIDQLITIERPTQKWAESSSSRWSAFPANTPAVTNMGTSIESAFTELGNFADASGATPGILGAGGALPTGWTQNATASGVTITVLDSGTGENGLPFVDLKFVGTPTADWSIRPSPVGHLAVSASTQYTASAWLALLSGTLGAPQHIQLGVNWYTAGDSLISNSASSLGGSLSANTHRYQLQATAPATSAKANIEFTSLTNAIPIDFSLRICVPNMGAASFATSPVLSAGTSTERSSDVMTSDLGWLTDVSQGLIVDEVMFGPTIGSGVEGWLQINDGTNNNRLGIERTGSSDVFAVYVRQSGAVGGYLAVSSTLGDGNFHKVATAWDSGQVRICVDGGSIVTRIIPAPMAGVNTLSFGVSHIDNRQPNGLMRQRIGYVGSGYSDAFLQAITS